MSRFNFTEILLTDKADISKVMDNFNLIEQNAALKSEVDEKVNKVAGKQLTTNDFTDVDKAKLDGLSNYNLPVSSSNTLGGVKTGNNITNSSGTISISKTNVVNALGYTPPATDTTYPLVTSSVNGIMRASDKSKLDGIASGANKTVVSNSLSDTSTTNALSASRGAFLSNSLNILSTALGSLQETYNKFMNDGGIIGGNLDVNGHLYVNNASIQSKYTYKNTSTNASNVIVQDTGNFRRSSSSSKRYKEDITQKLEERLNPQKLYDLPVVQFKYKEGYLNKDDRRCNENILGFIAEDVAEIYESAAQYNSDGNVEMWNYKILIPAMLKLIQEQHEDIEKLKLKVKEG